ncbi:MAG: phenylalanine--tRNA ligase subunit beta [Planctomycetes bacterium]|nr:phenylalanine--tRNA ligase subunit beta [Planctomycetota bacterium]
MKASYQWIREYVPSYSGTPDEMAEALTFSGTEVEEVEAVGDDSVLEIGITSNRVDSLCHLGLAREVAAVAGTEAVPPEYAADHTGGPTSEVTSVTVEDEIGCPRFTARVIEDVKVGPSPAWLKDRVESLGMRAINNVVDITNYVLHELNQPLHAYDLDKLGEHRIVVRRARDGEKLTAINGTEYALHTDDIVIADSEIPVGLAGVMGGLDTEVSESTERILLESAAFDGSSVRKTSRRHQLNSDASYRFERGTDRHGALTASERAARLILDVCGGTLRQDPIDVGGDGPAPEPITFRLARIETICGITVPTDRVVSILRALCCGVEENGTTLTVTPPTFRADLSREIDLVEEVIRIYGLDHLPVQAGMPIAVVHDHPARSLRERLKDRLVALGHLETVTPNFVKEGAFADVGFLVEGDGLRIRNPVRQGEGALRKSLLPSLLVVRKHNQDHGNDNVRIFELSNVHVAPASADADVPHLPVLGWMTDGDLRDARGVAEAALDVAGLTATVASFDGPWFESGTGGQLVDAAGKVLGVFGHPDKRLLKQAGVKTRPSYGELNLQHVLAGDVGIRRFQGMARFPGVVRDLSVDMAEATPFGDLQESVRDAALANLESLELFDVYRGKQVGAGKKTLSIRISFRSPEGTLTSDAVDAEIQRLVKLLNDRLHAEIRGA